MSAAEEEDSGGYVWRKYGEKTVGARRKAVQRAYFRCASSGCPAKKRVDRRLDAHPAEAPLATCHIMTHNHPPPRPQQVRPASSDLATSDLGARLAGTEAQRADAGQGRDEGGGASAGEPDSGADPFAGWNSLRAEDIAAAMYKDLQHQLRSGHRGALDSPERQASPGPEAEEGDALEQEEPVSHALTPAESLISCEEGSDGLAAMNKGLLGRVAIPQRDIASAILQHTALVQGPPGVLADPLAARRGLEPWSSTASQLSQTGTPGQAQVGSRVFSPQAEARPKQKLDCALGSSSEDVARPLRKQSSSGIARLRSLDSAAHVPLESPTGRLLAGQELRGLLGGASRLTHSVGSLVLNTLQQQWQQQEQQQQRRRQLLGTSSGVLAPAAPLPAPRQGRAPPFMVDSPADLAMMTSLSSSSVLEGAISSGGQGVPTRLPRYASTLSAGSTLAEAAVQYTQLASPSEEGWIQRGTVDDAARVHEIAADRVQAQAQEPRGHPSRSQRVVDQGIAAYILNSLYQPPPK